MVFKKELDIKLFNATILKNVIRGQKDVRIIQIWHFTAERSTI